MMSSKGNYLYYPMWMVLLTNIDNTKNASYYSRLLDFTYSSVSHVFDVFHKRGLITKEKNGRSVIIKLTKKGEKVAHPLRNHVIEMKKATGLDLPRRMPRSKSRVE